MASPAKRLPTNAPGDLYVDATCIDCDTCRWIAPETFDRADGQSRVAAQPAEAEALRRALMALVACPTASIGSTDRHDLKPVLAAFPDPLANGAGRPLPGALNAACGGWPEFADEPGAEPDRPAVFHCGYHHEGSFGAAAYLVARPEGNVLVDSPRFAAPLVRRLEELGGVRMLFLTHQDDVADHAKFAAHFGCERVLHADDLQPGTRDVERRLEGTEAVALGPGLRAIPTPGHTRGSACLLVDDSFLFTGDHLAWSSPRRMLSGFRGACWHDWGQVIESTRRLAAERFRWVLPGHGRRAHFPPERMVAELERGLAWMDSVR